MKALLTALMSVSRLDLNGRNGDKTEPAGWELVLARVLLSLVWCVAAAIVLWLMPQNRLIASIMATAAVVALRAYMCNTSERAGVLEIAGLLAPSVNSQAERLAYQHAIFNIVLAARPICLLLLILHGNVLWMAAASALSYAVALNSTADKDKASGGTWPVACAVALLAGGIASKTCQMLSGMFFISIIACVLCWLLSFAFEHLELKQRFESTLFLAEFAALLLGMIGQAF